MGMEQNQHDSDLYYSDSAIRERCLRMVYDERAARAHSGGFGGVHARPIDEAEEIFIYIKTNNIPDSMKKR